MLEPVESSAKLQGVIGPRLGWPFVGGGLGVDMVELVYALERTGDEFGNVLVVESVEGVAGAIDL